MGMGIGRKHLVPMLGALAAAAAAAIGTAPLAAGEGPSDAQQSPPPGQSCVQVGGSAIQVRIARQRSAQRRSIGNQQPVLRATPVGGNRWRRRMVRAPGTTDLVIQRVPAGIGLAWSVPTRVSRQTPNRDGVGKAGVTSLPLPHCCFRWYTLPTACMDRRNGSRAGACAAGVTGCRAARGRSQSPPDSRCPQSCARRSPD